LGFVLRPLLRTRLLLLTLTPACSCVYICKFQFRPIHPPLGDYQHFRNQGCQTDKEDDPPPPLPALGLDNLSNIEKISLADLDKLLEGFGDALGGDA
jgi:hypothetical protein